MKNLLIVSLVYFTVFYNFFIFADNNDFLNNTNNSKSFTENKFSFGFSGFIQYGESHGTAIAPQNGIPDNKGASYEMGYGFAGHVLYNLNTEWKIFFETGYSDRRILCARKDEYGIGQWVADMTGNTLNNYLGPFDNDVYFYMQTFIIRPGVKYYVLTEENIKPWFGIGLSVYPWSASYMDGDRRKIWGKTNGICFDLTFLYLGIDMNIDFGDKEKVILSLFADFGAPAVKLQFDNLFENGWTYVNEEGEEVIAPYKFGILMLFEL